MGTIIVSGVAAPIDAIAWPSGQFTTGSPGSNLCAFLSSMNATFGFNLTPHNFQLEFIPCGITMFHGASGQLPSIGSPLELYIGDFFFKGGITHADYTNSPAGTVVNVTVEDHRRTLRKVKLHTEDLGVNIPSGVVSIARVYRVLNGLKTIEGDPSDPLIKEYLRILQYGGTYAQIRDAIDYTYNEGKSFISSTILPTVEQLERNIGGDIEAIRFQFNFTPLDEGITRILGDAGYDWYWAMDASQVNLINRKDTFEVTESQILDLVSQFGSVSGLNETKQTGFGQDLVSDPTRFRVLGGHQEGFINSHLLSPIDGIDTFGIDGIVNKTTKNPNIQVVFTSAWDRLSVGFYDAGGFYRTYKPTNKELQLVLAGIESWTYFKKYQTNAVDDDPPGFGLPADAGSQAAQDDSFQSRLDPLMPLAGLATGDGISGIRIISNRRDTDHNWVISFYNRIHDHAARHFGRSYIAEDVIFNNASGLFRVTDASWANVENQVQGYALSPSGSLATSGIFIEDYEINRELGPISPFVTSDFKVIAHCKLPADTIYGGRGEDVPASFGNWTEDAPPFNPDGDGSHYIPVSITTVGQRIQNPRSDDLYAFETFPEGTLWCQLPIIAGPSGGLIEDSIISQLATLVTTKNKIAGSGLIDLINPSIILNPYLELSGVAIPIESRLRYGQSYPSQFFVGSLHYERDEDIQLDDQFVPWTYSPEGSQTTLQIMTDRAARRALGKIVNSSTSRYADFQQVGLPLLTFDAFAMQGLDSQNLYGSISHGVNELNINFGLDGFATRYKIQSYFPKFGREAPLGEAIRAQLNGILNPIDFTELKLLNAPPIAPEDSILPGAPFLPQLPFDEEQRAVKVRIIGVTNVFTLDSSISDIEDERYRGIDQHRYLKPPHSFASSNLDFSEGAICIDGFLNIDDEALYHTDTFELPGSVIIQRYFTQGRAFGQSTIVQIERLNADDPTKYDVTIVDPTALDTYGIERAIFGVEVLNGSVNIGEKTTLSVQGDAPVKPGLNEGTIFINGTSTGAGVTPVEIISVSSRGTINAKAVCRLINLDSNGTIITPTSGTLFNNVLPIPFPQFATSGDRGFMTSYTIPSGGFGKEASVQLIEIVKPAFWNF